MSSDGSEQFRLIFRGEIEDGQHPAVVKKRLASVLKLDSAAVDKLFAGGPVVLKKSATRDAAARLQKAFREAGARLRVQPLKAAASTEPSSAAGLEASTLDVLPPQPLPPGPAQPGVEVDTSHLSVVNSDEPLQASVSDPEPQLLDLGQFSLAEPGAELSTSSDSPAEPVIDLEELDLEVLPPGEGHESTEAVEVVELDIDFELAEPGERLGPEQTAPPPPPPDVSHLGVTEPEPGSARSG